MSAKFEFPMDPKEYKLLDIIGRGTCSKVYRAQCISNQQIIVIKIIELEEYPLSIETIIKQTAFWSICQHPNVVSYYGSFVVGSDLWILSEYLSGGSLFDILKFGYGSGIKDEGIIAYIASQIVHALDFLHENKEIHRDIRSGNILINSHGEVKISDFGMATSLIQNGKKKSAAISMYGDACYMAPEILTQNQGYTPKTDIWSFGLVVIEMVTGKMPYDGMKFMESMLQIISKDPPKISKVGHSSLLVDFVDQCMKQDPEKRASAKTLLEHKFLKLSKGPGPVITTILSKLPPLEQRYKLLYASKTEEEAPHTHPNQPVIEWQFNDIDKDDSTPKVLEPLGNMQQSPDKDYHKTEETVTNMGGVDVIPDKGGVKSGPGFVIEPNPSAASKPNTISVQQHPIFASSPTTDENTAITQTKERPPIHIVGRPKPKVEENTNSEPVTGNVEKVGRFSISRGPSISQLNDEAHFKSMQNEISQLSQTIQELETENANIKAEIEKVVSVIRQYIANHPDKII